MMLILVVLMMFDIQGNCFCESSGSSFGKAKVLYCYGEVGLQIGMIRSYLKIMLKKIIFEDHVKKIIFKDRVKKRSYLKIIMKLMVKSNVISYFRIMTQIIGIS